MKLPSIKIFVGGVNLEIGRVLEIGNIKIETFFE
jgi:hypothetical protein